MLPADVVSLMAKNTTSVVAYMCASPAHWKAYKSNPCIWRVLVDTWLACPRTRDEVRAAAFAIAKICPEAVLHLPVYMARPLYKSVVEPTFGVVLSPSKKWIAVSNKTTRSVMIIDAASGERQGAYPLSANREVFAFLSDQSLFLKTSEVAYILTVPDLAIVNHWNVDDWSTGIAVSPTRCVTHGTDAVHVFDHQGVPKFTIPTGVRGVTFAAGRIYTVSVGVQCSIHAWDDATGVCMGQVNVFPFSYYHLIVSETGLFAFATESGIFVVNPTSGTEKKTRATNPTEMEFSSDGQSVYCESGGRYYDHVDQRYHSAKQTYKCFVLGAW